ncbi:MAG: DUF86 domain-containing protein [Nitrospinae bacterium]|nr:DUF86 domain-containing protein [Nitrospinota bacterium]
MPPDIPKLLEDIREAGEFILKSAAGLDFDQFDENRLLRQAVERNFEIIGEALLRIRRSDPKISARIGDELKIIGFRNVIAHGYDMIDNEIVWLIIHNELPVLISKVRDLLKDAEGF